MRHFANRLLTGTSVALRQLEQGARLRMVGRSGEPARAWYVYSSWRAANGQQVWQDFVRRNDENGRWRQTFRIRGGAQTILVQARSRDERCGVRFDYQPGVS